MFWFEPELPGPAELEPCSSMRPAAGGEISGGERRAAEQQQGSAAQQGRADELQGIDWGFKAGNGLIRAGAAAHYAYAAALGIENMHLQNVCCSMYCWVQGNGICSK